MKQKIEITKSFYDELNNELTHLIDVVRPEIIAQIQAAREQGDLSENADYDSAKQRQAEIESRINEIKNTLDNSIIVSDTNIDTSKVSLMTYVTYLDLEDGQEYKFRILGAQGSNPADGSISSESPVGKALLGKKVGDEVEIFGVDNHYSVKILNISNK